MTNKEPEKSIKNTLQEEREAIVESLLDFRNCPPSCDHHGTYADSDEDGEQMPAQCQWCYEEVMPMREILRTALLSHEEKVVAWVRRTVEEMPAFTCCSDKCMGQVSDEAKKPRWGTNYLERETLLTIISLPITDEKHE